MSPNRKFLVEIGKKVIISLTSGFCVLQNDGGQVAALGSMLRSLFAQIFADFCQWFANFRRKKALVLKTHVINFCCINWQNFEEKTKQFLTSRK
jgi:hypothetical protein